MADQKKLPNSFAKSWKISGKSIQTGDVHGDDLAVAASSPEQPPATKGTWGGPGYGSPE